MPSLMPLNVLHRPHWHGTSRDMGELFILRKNRRGAKAVLFTHPLGCEVRLMIGAQAEVVQTEFCCTQEDVFATGEQWKAAMGEKG